MTKEMMLRVQGQLLGFASIVSKLVETLTNDGHITQEERSDIFVNADRRAWFVCQNLRGSMPVDELREIEVRATELIVALDRDTTPRV